MFEKNAFLTLDFTNRPDIIQRELKKGKKRMHKLAVLVSGNGSNLEAILRHPLPVAVVIADRSCPAIEVAARAEVPHAIIERTFGADFDRNAFTETIRGALRNYDIEVIAMAGFMTVLAPSIFLEYPGVLNTHPSLLPAFKGAHAVRDALAAGARITGCTVHIATEQLDEGLILAQQQVPILSGDTESTLHERIKVVERKLYPKTIEGYLKSL